MTSDEKCQQAAAILQEWAAKKMHDRRHWHPDVLQRLADVFGVEVGAAIGLPSEMEFAISCEAYRREQYWSDCGEE